MATKAVRLWFLMFPLSIMVLLGGCASAPKAPDECTFASKLAAQVVIAEQKPEDNGAETEAAITAAIRAYQKQSGLSDDEAEIMYQSMIHAWSDAKVDGATPASVSADLLTHCIAYVARHGAQKSAYDGRPPPVAPRPGDINS